MRDRFSCPHCMHDLREQALVADRWRMDCVHCTLPVAIAYDLVKNNWYYHLEKVRRDYAE